MNIRTELEIAQPRERVWEFSIDPMNQLLWDRSVAQVVLTSEGPVRVGYTFETVGPNGLRTAYRVAELEPQRHAKVEVTKSRTFARAMWSFVFEPTAEGTRVVWEIELVPRARYFFLGLLLRLNRHQLVRDMKWFEAALAAQDGT